MSAVERLAVKYRVHYFRKSDGAGFVKDFSTHVAAKAFACKKQHEPGWCASFPTKRGAAG